METNTRSEIMKSIQLQFSDGFGSVSRRLPHVQDWIRPPCGRWMLAKSGFKTAILLAGAMSVAASVADAATYYVATNGNDTNAGSISAPFATFNNATWRLNPGDTLYARAGVYYQDVYAYQSGAPALPITISGYPGEIVVIDGQFTNSHGYLIDVKGSNVIVQNMTVRRSEGTGVTLTANYDQANNIYAQSNLYSGMYIDGSSNCIISNCWIYFNSMDNINFAHSNTGAWSPGFTAAWGCYKSLLISNKVWNNWGEGMSTFQSTNTMMIGNIVWDNYRNVYLSDTIYSVLNGNLIYSTVGNAFSNWGQFGIGVGDEQYAPASSNNIVIDNLVLGCYNNLTAWGGTKGGGLLNVIIANNTFANAVNAGDGDDIVIDVPTHTNSIIENNMFLQEIGKPGSIAYAPSAISGITFAHNLWSTNQLVSFVGTGDRIANPLLLESGLIGPGQLRPNWFFLLSNSPAIGAGIALTVVSNDFLGMARPQHPSIGAIEGAPLPQPPTELHIVNP